MLQLIQFFEKHEKLLFAFLTFSCCGFFFYFPFFPTLDGPAHLYNAHILGEFLFGDPGTLADYFEINPELLPNYTGHLLLVFFGTLFHPALAEKIFLCIYLISFCYAFRYFIKSFSNTSGWMAILAFPFGFSVFIYLGFYNFSLSTVFFLLAISVWVKILHQGFDKKRILNYALLSLLVFFSHLSVFLVMMVVSLSLLLFHVLQEWKTFNNRKSLGLYAARKGLLLALCNLPGILFSALYVSDRAPKSTNYLDASEVIQQFLNAQPFVAFSHEEIIYARILLVTAVFSIITLLVLRIYDRFRIQSQDALLFCAIGFIVVAFLVPNGDERGGYYILRILYFIFLFLFLWIASQKCRLYLLMLFTLIIGFTMSGLILFRTWCVKTVADSAADVYYASQLIEEGAVVLPILKKSNDLVPHHSNYLGIDKNIVILENYEAANDYFPIRSKRNSPIQLIQNPQTICEVFPALLNQGEPLPDYIFVLGNETMYDSVCEKYYSNYLEASAELKYSSPFCSLYKINK